MNNLKLQMNLKGAWRDVVSFVPAMEATMKSGAEQLFGHDKHVTLRIISPADSGPPLACWSAATGWRTWGERSPARDPAPATPDPLIQARKDITLLRTALGNLLGATTATELGDLETGLNLLKAVYPVEDLKVSMGAIQAMRATMPPEVTHGN